MAPAELPVLHEPRVAHSHVVAVAEASALRVEVAGPALEEEDVRVAEVGVVLPVLAPVVVAEEAHERRAAVARELAVEHDAHVLAAVLVVDAR